MIPDFTDMLWNVWGYEIVCTSTPPTSLGKIAGQLLMTSFHHDQLWRCAPFCWNMQSHSVTPWTVSDVLPCTTQHVADTRRRVKDTSNPAENWTFLAEAWVAWHTCGFDILWYHDTSCLVESCWYIWSQGAVFDKCDNMWKWLSDSVGVLFGHAEGGRSAVERRHSSEWSCSDLDRWVQFCSVFLCVFKCFFPMHGYTHILTSFH